MLERRRSHLRRALSTGSVFAVAGTALLALIEVVYVLAVRRPAVDYPLGTLEFIVLTLLGPLGPATVVGALLGAMLLGVSLLAHRMAGQRLAVPRWTARIICVLASPAIALFAAQLFSGGWVQQIPAKQLFVGLLGVAGLAATYLLVIAILAARERLRMQRWSRRQVVAVAAALVAAAVAFYVLDQRLFVRLHVTVHVALALAALGCAVLATLVTFGGWRPRRRALGRLVEPRAALVLVAVAVGGSAWGLQRLRASEQLRFVTLEHTALHRKLLLLTKGFGTIAGAVEGYALDRDSGKRTSLGVGDETRRRRLRSGLAVGVPPAQEGKSPVRRRSWAARVLERARRRQRDAIPDLIRLCSNRDTEVRREAVRLLIALRAHEAREEVLRLRDDPDPGVALQATIGSALFGNAASRDELSQILKRADLPPIMRRDALTGRALAGDRSVTVSLAEALRRADDVNVRIEIIEALGELGDPRGAEALAEQASAPQTRRHAIDALGLVGAPGAVPLLLRFVREERNTGSRQAAIRALGRVRDRRAVPVLQRVLLQDPDSDVVAETLQALSRLDALGTRGLTVLRPEVGWHCRSGRGCQRALGVSCGHRQELLLLAEGGDRSLEVYCGQRVVGAIDKRQPQPGRLPRGRDWVPASVVDLSSGSGDLLLKTAGGPVELRFIALRQVGDVG